MASAWRNPSITGCASHLKVVSDWTTPDLSVLGDCMTAMESVASNLDESTGYFISHGRLLEKLADAERDLDRRVAESIEAERRNERSQPIPHEATLIDAHAATLLAPDFGG